MSATTEMLTISRMKHLRNVIWLQILAMSVLVFMTAKGERSSYGEVCNKNKPCDKAAWLACISGKCVCVKPDEMTFNPQTEKCASRAGERCKYLLDSDGEKRYEEISCVDNAECSSNGFCACEEDFYENFNGSCIGKGVNFEACNNTSLCSNKKGFICKDGVCRCEESASVFSPTFGQCVGLVSHFCINGKCTEGSSCTVNGECICEEKFYRNSEDRCAYRLNRLDSCTADIQCKNGGGYNLKCLRGICECDPDISVFGTALQHVKYCNYYTAFYQFDSDYLSHCLGKVGKRCIEGRCATGSFCKYDDSCNSVNFEGTCDCTPGTSPSLQGTCGKGYNAPCSSTGECLTEMVCTSSICECRYSGAAQYYDSNKQSCINRVGIPCGNLSMCDDGAECKTLENSQISTCECMEGYVDDAGTCKMEFGMACTDNKNCYSDGGLICIERTCQCNDFKMYNKNIKKCVGLAGANCHLKEKQVECIENSSCVERVYNSRSTSGRCSCNKGYIVSTNFTCQRNIPNNDEFPVISFSVDMDDSEEEASSDVNLAAMSVDMDGSEEKASSDVNLAAI